MSNEQKQNVLPPGLNVGGGARQLGMVLPGDKAKKPRQTMKRLFCYLIPYRLQILAVILTAILGTAFTIISPKILGQATTIIFAAIRERISTNPSALIDFPQIGRILIILAGLYTISTIFLYLEQYIMAGVAQNVVFDMRRDFSQKLARLPLRYFDENALGDTLSRATNDMDTVGSTLQQTMTQFITSFVTITGIFIMMLTISVWMTLITLVTLPLTFYITAKIAKRSQKNYAAQQRELGRLNGHVEEMCGGHVIVKAFANEKKSLAEFRKINEQLNEAGWRAQFISGLIMPIIGFLNNLGYVLICIVGAVFVTQGRIAIGDLQAFIQYSRQFTQPIIQTANVANAIQSTFAAAERVFDLLDEEEEKADNPHAPEHLDISGHVRFENVRFRYLKDRPLIENLNIDVRSGQAVAIVGPTGAGKTTLVNLLMRFYDIGGGHLTIDGVDIRDIKRSSLRRLFGMVLQDTWLFKGTIKENIAYGREDATEEEIIRAAKAARADHFIRTLPHGYDTVLNEEGTNISQGQKQLLTIARALLADPAILILDEATSSVDTRTELLIQKAMAELMKGRTSFVIAHRLSTIRDADTILVMNDGHVVEVGTHTELLDKKGFYASLYYSQFSYEETVSDAG